MLQPAAPAQPREEIQLTKDHNDGFSWSKSRVMLNRLFEGYYKDYGQVNGDKIIRTIIDVLGGCRITIPEKLSGNKDNKEVILILYKCFCDRFGKSSGLAIMRKFIMELKSCRISFPDYDDLYREERNRRIRDRFTGCNYKELSIMFGLDLSHVWRIVNEK